VATCTVTGGVGLAVRQAWMRGPAFTASAASTTNGPPRYPWAASAAPEAKSLQVVVKSASPKFLLPLIVQCTGTSHLSRW
jgi:hypothetical protein